MLEENPQPVESQPPAEVAAPPAEPAKRKRRRPSAEELSDRKLRRWAELLETIILTVATLAVTWAGYQSALWGGTQTSFNIDATTQRIEASQASALAQQLQLIDIGLFTNWINAFAQGNEGLADFYEARFRDEFKPAFEAWIATGPRENPNAPASPFAMPEYKSASYAEAAALEEEAGRLTQEAERAGGYSDRYTLMAVILAGALLLAGLASRFEWEELRAIVVGTALLVLLFSVVQILLLPRA